MDREDEAFESIAMLKPYNDYNSYLKNIHGTKVYKIGIDAGFSCPNRDGTIGIGGCAYCNERGSRSSYTNPAMTVSEQISSRIRHLKDRFGAEKFIAYFQAFTNTHAPASKLKSIYDSITDFEDIVGLSIGTRPDSVDEDKMLLVSSYRNKYDVWVEYGLQSSRDDILMQLGRGHTFGDFVSAISLAQKYGVKTCAHVILGLPGETEKDVLNTARILNDLRVDGIKIHLLHILKGSRIEDDYRKGKIKLLSQGEYVNMVCNVLENLSPDIVIHRITGEGDRDNHIAPAWAMDKINTINMIEGELTRRGTRQGARV